jgi:hypothetical protein
MDQETFNKMLQTALAENLTFNVIDEPDMYGVNPDMTTIQFLFNDTVIATLVLNPLY